MKYANNFIIRRLMNWVPNFLPSKIRRCFYNLIGFKVGKGTNVRRNIYISSTNISIGSDSFVNQYCKFYSGGKDAKIKIGDRCRIAMEVSFIGITHEIGSAQSRAGADVSYPIKVGNGCWIGARSTILPGVTVGDGCIIAAGSVVNKDCEPNSLYAGVPARKIKDLH